MAQPTSSEEMPDAAAVRIVAVDMDGTLLDANGVITPGTWEVLFALRDQGITVVPASGRQYSTLAELFAPFVTPEHTLTVIAENGGVVIDDGKLVSTHSLPKPVVAAVLSALETADLRHGSAGAVMCTPYMAYVESDNPAFLAEARRYYKALEIVPDLTALLAEDHELHVVKMAMFAFDGSTKVLQPVLDIPAVTSVDGTTVARAVVSSPNWMDVMPTSVNKGVALADLHKAVHLGPENTVAFGDYLNDLELLDHAEISVAMANAHPEVLQRARYVAHPNTEEGVARFCRELFGLS